MAKTNLLIILFLRDVPNCSCILLVWLLDLQTHNTKNKTLHSNLITNKGRRVLTITKYSRWIGAQQRTTWIEMEFDSKFLNFFCVSYHVRVHHSRQQQWNYLCVLLMVLIYSRRIISTARGWSDADLLLHFAVYLLLVSS